MRDMVVSNVSSKSGSVKIGKKYLAKVDSTGQFRVKDDNGRWSKFSPLNFVIEADPDNQISHYGDSPEVRVEKVSPDMGDTPTTFETEDTDDTELNEMLASLVKKGVDVAVSDGVVTPEKLRELLSVPTVALKKPFVKAKVGDTIRMLTLDKYSHCPPMSVSKVYRIESVDKASVTTTEHQVLYDRHEEYEIVSAAETVGRPVVPEVKSEKVEEKSMKKSRTLRELLMEQGVSGKLVDEMNEFRRRYTNNDLDTAIKSRIPKPVELYEGGELWTDCITAILAGRHILLSGGKATGKNTLTQSLAFAFQRPMWDMSFHKNIGKDELIGSETFRGGEVVFNPGMAYMCGLHGGFGVFDEINMANEGAISVLNSILDDRRVIDVPGYDRLNLHPATVFIGTMNYGYAGTRPLNEALASRFVIPNVAELDSNGITKLLLKKFPNAKVDTLRYFAGAFTDLQTKAKNAEISTASVDLRGIISALSMIEFGMNPNKAMVSNVVNKSFEEFERKIVADVVNSRIPTTWGSNVVFGSSKTLIVDMSEVK